MNERLLYLLHKFYNKAISPAEKEELFLLIEEGRGEAAIKQYILNTYSSGEPDSLPDESSQEILQAIFSTTTPVSPVRRRTFFLRRLAAASVLFILAAGVYFWLQHSRPQAAVSNHNSQPADIAPGRQGAVLTLSNGTQVILDSLGDGLIAMQSGARVLLQNGQLAYDLTGERSASMMYNTISIPKGRQFNLQLADGSRVWLNSASSLRYPAAFSNKERRVTITGEAYFEVVKDAKKPFRVNINNLAEVEVLGTSFNVNAYENEESINTTLLEGAVAVALHADGQQEDKQAGHKTLSSAGHTQPGEQVILKPGQQAQIAQVNQKTHPGIKVIGSADLDKVIAWKNGAFNFNGASLQEVMRQLERWYDIEVEYEKGVPDIQFGGELGRDISLAGLLKALKESEVRFRIESDRRLVVLP